ncbi:MAG: ABC transporter permease, partial [Alcaligenaceae bacterium]|nr:ABC transporter permease [Alcaligenaceae bacterium]
MSKKQRVSPFGRKLAMVIAMALILLFWQAAAWTLPDFLMPGVPAVIVRLWHDIQTEEFRQILSGSLGRLG